MFKLYDSQPFGTATFANLEKTAVSDVTIDFLVASYMDNPTRLLSIPRLEGGEKVEVPLRALFSEQVLKITEATKVSGKLSISFVLDGKPYSREFTQTVALNNRNNIAWDDTRKAATFVTPNDPLVLTLAKSSVAATADMSIGQVDPWLADAMAIHEALRAKGQRYSIDPNTPFDQISRNAEVLDTVYFPQETLAYGAGDCDDLSVLFNALLQSVGAQTAFITIPGHIYAAVKLDVSPNRVSKAYSRPQDFIIRDGSVWLPVEITMTASRFADAWQTGAQEWREYSAKGQAELLPVLSSWSVYEPVGQIPPLATAVNLPAPAAIAAGYRGEMSRFIDQEIARRAEPLRKEIADRKSDPRPVNSLGVVYAEYGRIDLATPQFEAASAMNDYLPALINLAGVRFISRDYATALSLYRRAKDRATSNPSVLLGLARSLAALEQYDEAGVYYRTLQDVSPDLASQFAYLAEQGTGAVRAAGQESQRSRMVWDEEGQ
jgi:tetratricopeptide (TPR) repeat protein